MLGSRTKIVLLSGFFAFTFALLFFALIQNYVHAESVVTSPVRIVAVTSAVENQSLVYNEIVPSFGQRHEAAGFDYDSDDSFQKYLSTDHPFTDSSYTPVDLIPIDSNFTANNSKAFKLREEASIQFADMAWHFRNTFSGDKLYISSAYRSRGLQDYLIKQGCSFFRCAQVGTSEHQAGLAVDLKVIARGGRGYSLDAAYPNKYFERFKANAAEFGFHNTYQKGVEIDGKMVEGRHRRYVGVELAKTLAENKQTFAEYYKNLVKSE